MLQLSGYIPQRQFHVLVSLPGEEHNFTVLPDTSGHFRVMEHGEVVGEVSLTPENKCVPHSGNLKKSILNQLEDHIKNYYREFKNLFG